MKKILMLPLFTVFCFMGLSAQVTQINSNKSLELGFPLSNSLAIYVSGVDSTVWVTNGTLAGTFQLSPDIKFFGSLGSINFLDGKMIFEGSTAATGRELYITDGSVAGTMLLSDINPGPAGSLPNEAAALNGFLYFTSLRVGFGRELWRTDGTLAGTTMVKDIVPGPSGSNALGNYQLFSSGTYLLFAAETPASGIELWRSDGTDVGTVVLKDINTGNAGADPSNPRAFYQLNNVVLFAARDQPSGEEIWRTDGTASGTFLLKDINPLTGNSTTLPIAPGFDFPVFTSFHFFNNKAYFNATNGISGGQVWSTDGSVANTGLLKDIAPGPLSIILLVDAVNLANKFIFPVATQSGLNELWESDGTTANTKVFKSFDGPDFAFLFPAYNFNAPFNQMLFQGNKFFFMASTVAAGSELWISDGADGTTAHTNLLRDINAGSGDGVTTDFLSYIYTTPALYFPATNGTNGVELWKSDGTSGGTSMVADIIPGLDSSKPNINFFLVNNKILFEATNGDDPTLRDLYAVDGIFTPLPVSLTYFTVKPKAADAILNWQTSQEINSTDFTVQKSFNGLDFSDIGTIAAAGTSTISHAYSFTDIGVMNSGQNTVYYRLKNKDIDGKISYSPVITLKLKHSGNWSVRLLVNPVMENIPIILSGITENLQLSIVDMSGKKIATYSKPAVNGQISLPTSGLARGRYVLVVETVNEKKTIQFVK